MVPFAKSLTIALSMFLLFSCGYRFSPGGEHIDRGLQTVYIKPFINKTSESNIESIFRAAFIDWFIKGNRFQIVDQADMADTIWSGTIKNVSTTALSYRTSNLAAEERMTVVMELKFVERASNKEIWADKGFSAYQDYPIMDVMNTENARKNAFFKLSMYAAEKAYRAMMSGF